MPSAREGYKRITGEISEAMHNKITWYNKISAKPLNVSKAIEICIAQEVQKIEQEAVEFVRENKGIMRGSTEDYNKAVEGIKIGLPASEVYKIAISNIHYGSGLMDFGSTAYLPLLPVNRMHFDEDKQKICFFVDKVFCLALQPYDCKLDM